MTMEEKAKLGVNLQELPPEKLGQLIQILKKRTTNLSQDGDEIELDIEELDNETLWELDRFVTNYKNMASKIKRQGFIQNLSTPIRNLSIMKTFGDSFCVFLTVGVKWRKGARKDPKIGYEYVYYDQKINSILSLPATLNGLPCKEISSWCTVRSVRAATRC
ncbi:unnamed protein product [Brassica rapa subsp. narinosa]